MKSFRLVSLQIITADEQLANIELTEGLTINREDEHNRWLIEAFVHRDHYPPLAKAIEDQNSIRLQATITKKENNPASFQARVLTIKKVDEYYSVLFEGQIISNHIQYTELLLEKLVENGLNGQELINAFKEKIRSKAKRSI
ncbi:MAG: YwpF family protein [Bacillus sp. (in: firmicutes)]